MNYYPMHEFFSELGTFPSGVEVGDLKLMTKDRSLRMHLRFDRVWVPEEIEALLHSIKIHYGLSRIDARVCFPEHTLVSEGIPLALRISTERSPSVRAILEGATQSVSGDRIDICLKKGGAELLRSWAEEVRLLLHEWYSQSIQIEIRNPDELDRYIAEIELDRSQSIEEAKAAVPARMDRKKSAESVLLGRKFKADYLPISELNLETGQASVKGMVFSVDHRELKNNQAAVVCFDITDYTGSIRVSNYMEKDKAEPIIAALKVGIWVAVKGKTGFNKYDNDIVLSPDSIVLVDQLPEKADEHPQKRVELHLHTQMSSMDAVVSAKDVIERAAKWGHRAVAITDHGVVQAFPEAMSAADAVNKKRSKDEALKVIYGTECYFVNDIERLRSVYGTQSAPLDGDFVAFDIETTGLNAKSDRIIEIGAVLFSNGEVIDTFNAMVDPGRPIPPEITKLTGIDDTMVRGQPDISAVLPAFINFVSGRVLAAHNATFDISFISEACKRLKINYHPTFLDTRNMARGLLTNLSKFDLHTVSQELNIQPFQHHRASDDAGAVAYILFSFFSRLMGEGIRDIQDINGSITRASGPAKNALFAPKHMILLAKNQQGLQDLYELVSLSHLKYFKRVPIIPRSELDRRRSGLLVGSACESGELYTAIVDGKSPEELRRIAEYYDYLEIQPLSNNDFLLRNGAVPDRKTLEEYNCRIVRLGEELGKPVAATCDVHFLDPKDEVFRRILMYGKGFEDADKQPPLFFRTTDEMLKEFDYLGPEKAAEVVIEAPNRIADSCELVRPIKQGTFSPEIEGADRELTMLVEENVLRLYGDTPPAEVRTRVDEELNSIVKHHFDVIYMIAQKLVSKSLQDGYLVGSRGSVGSSVVAFFSGITEVNSLPPHYRCPACKQTEFIQDGSFASGPDLPDKTCPSCGVPYDKDGFDIPFATFLGFDGDKKPDIDLNFSGQYQARAHRETENLFGKGHVYRAGTIGTLAEKTAYGFVKKYNEDHGLVMSRAEENRLIIGMVGVKRTTGQHPGGLIVVPKGHSIYEFCPIQHPADDPNTEIVTTHFDYHSIEENLLKLDLLGHDDPTMIRMLFDLTGRDPQKIPLDDPETMSLFTSTSALGFSDDPICGTTGTFAVPEFGTKFVREMLSVTKPTTFDELVRISGLSHGTDVWINNSQDIILSGKATLKEIISARDDIMLFLIGKGLDRKLAFTIMESVRKGKGLRPEWEAEMRGRQVPDWYLESCNKIKYMFPKAHACAYVLMAFRIAWYKVHTPLAFYSAYFTIRAGSFDARIMTRGLDRVKAKILEIQNMPNPKQAEKDMLTTLEVCYEFYKRGFSFTEIDLYRSGASTFIPAENALLPPFTSIPGLGEVAAEELVSEREKGAFLSIEELSLRCSKVSKSILEILQSEGVLGDLPDTSQVRLF